MVRPSSGAGGSSDKWNRLKSEHDTRTNMKSQETNLRSDNFKPNRSNKKFRRNINAELLLNSDVDLGGVSRIKMQKGFRRGGHSSHNSNLIKKRFIVGSLPWYQVIIPFGAKYDKELILKALLSFLSPDNFIPHYYKISGNSATFYVDDAVTAEKLFYAHRKITLPDGFLLLVIVRNSVPNVTLDDNLKEKMKMAMAKRYNPATKAMDLTKFHADPDLSEVFCVLFRPVIMLAAVDIISENIPDLEALNLSDNRLYSTGHLKVLPTKLTNLKVLYLGDNKIPHIRFLERLKGLKLVELNLKGNPLVSKYDDKELYISDIRKIFPKLLKLYFTIYDSESRQPLLEAYHENAMMSMSASYASNDTINSESTKLNSYICSSRNLLLVPEREARRRHLRNGFIQIVSFLSDLPRTKHDLMGFQVDLSTFTPQMILVTINGVFCETNTPGHPMRSFHRTLVITPNGSRGFCITNDILFITNAAPEQIEASFKDPFPAAVVTPPVMQNPGPSITPIVTTIAPVINDVMKMQIVMMLSQQTGMNEFWSTNCLQEMNWDPNLAVQAFAQLNAEGKIPPEAFNK